MTSRRAGGWVLGTSVTVMNLGAGIIAPALPLFGQSFGVRTALVGLLITAFGLGRLVLNLPAGYLADRVGRRAVLLGSPLIVAVTAALAAAADSFPHLVLWRFLQGAGAAMFTTAAMTAMADLGGEAGRGRALSMFQGAMLLGVAFGPGIGGVVAARFGLRAPFVVYAGLAMVSLLWVYLQVPEMAPPAPAVTSDRQSEPRTRTFRRQDFLLIVLVAFVLFFTRAGGRSTILPLFAYNRLHLNTFQVGLILSLIAAINVLVLYPTGVLSDRFGRKVLIVPGLLLMAVSLAQMALARSNAALLLAAVVLGMGGGIGGPSPAAYMADLGPPGRIGTVMGLFRTAGDVGFFLGPLLLGWVADVFDYRAALLANAAIVFVVAVPFALLAKEYRDSPS